MKKSIHDECRENPSPVSLTSKRVLAKSTLWNLIGQGVPLLVAMVSIPILIKGLGVDRFGVLLIIWGLIGYFGLFDLGLGRAMTKMVSEKIGTGQPEEIRKIVWTTLLLMCMLGIGGAIVVTLLAPWIVGDLLKVPKTLQGEALNSFYLIAASIPIVIISVSLNGVLEAYQRFDLTNVIKVPLGLFTFLSPLIVLPFSRSLVGVIAVLIAGRIAALMAYLILCLQVIPALRKISIHNSVIKPLLSFGMWMTVTNIVSPLMFYMDRFFIGAVLSMSAVAYYTTPYEVVIRLTIIPLALEGVLFPAFSTSLVHDREKAVMLFNRAVKYIFALLFPLTLVIVTFSGEGLELWLGQQFAQNSTFVLQWLAVGVLINSLARIPFAMVQAEGRPDMTAKLHLIELPVYLVALSWLLPSYGIKGAAVAWVFRVALDAVVLFLMTYRLVPGTSSSANRLCAMLFAGLPILLLCGVINELFIKAALLLLILTTFTFAVWFLILDPDERHLVKGKLRTFSLSDH